MLLVRKISPATGREAHLFLQRTAQHATLTGARLLCSPKMTTMPARKIAALLLLGAGGLLLPNCSSDDTPGTGNTTAGTATTGGAGASTTGGGGAATAAGTTSGGAGASTGGAGSSAGGKAGGGGGSGGVTTGGGGSGGSGGSAAGSGGASGGNGGNGGSGGGGSGTFAVTSPDHADGAKFSKEFTCDAMNGTFGSGVNPDLKWSGVPAGTMSFAITFIDTKIGEDMAMGQHWAAWDIPAAAMELPKGTTSFSGALAGAKQTNKYLSPCPSGDDTYAFTIYALPMASLAVTGAEGTGTANSAGVAKVLAALKTATPLGKAVLTGKSGAMGK
jgi:phosphatidylethanolamine-binding protein (PEBP) family uncharacterized protein